ncbi:MAG TPA: PEP-CTERM sorting domain-containing protein [Candidatus Limnocylindrales bacterium]|nr:PEP-CTERM sorting domain-containing protein [Candidatus Limnocylindrales bacterium]
MKKVLVLSLGLVLVALMSGVPALADSTIVYDDPANLHIGPGAGTTCATGCGSDPNTIGTTGFDIYYNSQGSGNLAIGDPFYVIVATPVYTGSTNSPTVGGTATLISPYPGGSSTTVNVGGAQTGTEMTSANSGTIKSVYDAVGITLNTNNSFSFVNMVACDNGTAGCANGSLLGSNAPLFGVNIVGFDVSFFSIGTTNFNPGDLLDFTGTLPIGSYVAAVGVNGTEAWAVPFTESGLVTGVPEPSSLLMLGAGLLGMALLASRRSLTA